jgi:hypothetical protein
LVDPLLAPPAAIDGGTRGSGLPSRRCSRRKESLMSKTSKKVRLSRETLRYLDERGRAGGPIGTFPDTMLPNNCRTASCKPGFIC